MKLDCILKNAAILLTCFSLSSCLHEYYSPNSANVPLFKQKGEARLNAYYSGGAEEIAGAEIQGALAVSDNIAIIVNTAFMNADDGDESGSGNLFQAAAGYFKPFAKNFVFETYGGLGFGNAKNTYFSYSYTSLKSRVNFTKLFIQPEVGFTVKNVDFGVVSKFSTVFMKVNEWSGEEGYDRYDLQYIKDHPTSYLWERSFFVRFGFQPVKLQLQWTWSSNLNNKDLSQETQFASIGLSFNIQPKAKK